MPLRRHRERYEVPGTARFLTFSCYRRLRLFDNDRIKTEFVARLTERCAALDVAVFAWVVMPEHVHLVAMPRDERTTVATFLHGLKGPFWNAVLRRWRELDPPILAHVAAADGHRFWERGGGYDRNVDGAELLEKVRYCHHNPLKRGLCATSVDWPWSSARAYESRSDAIGPPIAFDEMPDADGPLT